MYNPTYQYVHDIDDRILSGLSVAALQLVTLLCGTWFRIISHDTMSSEAMAKCVSGSVFHTCAEVPEKVNRAASILQVLLDCDIDAEHITGIGL